MKICELKIKNHARVEALVPLLVMEGYKISVKNDKKNNYDWDYGYTMTIEDGKVTERE